MRLFESRLITATNLLVDKDYRACHPEVIENVLWFWSNLLGDDFMLQNSVKVADSIAKSTCHLSLLYDMVVNF